MHRSFERTGYCILLLLAAVFGVSSFMKPDTRSNTANLHVPFIPQYADNWCWAAATSMVLQYENVRDANIPALNQCQYQRAQIFYRGDSAKWAEYLPLLDTFPPSAYAASVFAFQSGNPFSDPLGHTFTTTIASTQADALPYDTLYSEFQAGRPVIFGWWWTGITQADQSNSSAHWMVACGAPHSSYFNGNHGYILVNDPWPTGRGKHRIMLYSEYGNKKPMDYSGFPTYAVTGHYQDYYHITYTGK